ncbi:MAG: hypothetical protein A2Z43_02865 [Syntrophobacterales bacterium RBG_19FT_COMBO_59_10]|nr:MAG: hypothetical protein A2Z43_02865 [Syntrophobacterales bacterium RBG_19FT_COMBO_59_10]
MKIRSLRARDLFSTLRFLASLNGKLGTAPYFPGKIGSCPHFSIFLRIGSASLRDSANSEALHPAILNSHDPASS